MTTGPDFWRWIDQSGGPDSCWPWLRSVHQKRGGYGQVRDGDRVRRAHIVAYELAIGPVPGGAHLDHTCHDPDTCESPCFHTRCCNPRHLEPVTQAENNHRRSRSTCGRGHPKTPEHGRPRGTKWRCVSCEQVTARARRSAKNGAE
jgi:hypothetical protein